MKRSVSAQVVIVLCLMALPCLAAEDDVRQWQAEMHRAKDTDPDKARQLSTKLIAHFEQAAQALLPEVAKAEKAFQAAFDAWNKARTSANDQKLSKAGEAWVELDQKYVVARAEQLASYLQLDAVKKAAGIALAAHCESMAEHENLLGMPTITAWFGLMQGRALVAIEDLDKASECFGDVLRTDLSEVTGDRRKHLTSLLQLAARDLVKLSVRKKKYADVESAMLDIQTNVVLKPMLGNDIGKDLLLDYADAVSARADKTDDYQNLIRTLREQVQKEAPESPWRNRFSLAISDTIERCRQKFNALPALSAEDWLLAASGCHAMADYQAQLAREANAQSELKTKSLNQYESAVTYYRYAITTARSAKTNFAMRVNVEPQAWLQMSRCLVWLGQHYEAIVSLQALMTTYAPDMRKQWLPELKKPDQKQMATALNSKLQDVDQNFTAVAQKIILQIVAQNSRNKPDHWNQSLRLRCIKEAQGRGYRLMDEDFLTAQQSLGDAKLLADAAKRSPRDEAALRQAVEKYAKAAASFSSVREDSPDVEAARFSACVALTNAYELLQRVGTQAEQARTLAQQGLKALQAYQAFVEKRAASTDEERARRARQQGFVLLAGTTLYCGAAEWEQAIGAAEAYIKWARATPQTENSAIDAALLNQFRATVQLAARDAQKTLPLLEAAERVLEQYSTEKPEDVSGIAQMLGTVAQRYTYMAQSVDGNVALRKSAVLQLRRLALLEKNAMPTTLDEWTRLIPLLKRAGDLTRIVEHGGQLLGKFDPHERGCLLPDDEKFWQDYAAKMRSAIKYADLNKWERCSQDHAALADLMYDTREGAARPNGDAKRPAFDRVNQDLEKARAQIATIKRNYADCATLKEGVDSLVGKVEHEIEFRQKIAAVREYVLEAALKLAASAEEQGKTADAQRSREFAAKQLELIRRNGDTPSLQIKHAQLLSVTGKADAAINEMRLLRRNWDSGDPLYFAASKTLSEAYAVQKMWREAAEFPEFVVLAAGLDSKLVKENWPELQAFLEKCYVNGAPRPAK